MNRTSGLTALALTFALALPALAEEKRIETARTLLKEKHESVVWVTAVAKMQASGMGIMLGGGGENKVEALGTVVDKSGMVVVCYSQLDMAKMIGGAIKANVGGESKEIELKTDLTDVKIRLADGTEMPASIVMKDEELNIAFVAPDRSDDAVKKARFVPLDLGDAVEPKVLDDTIILGRLGKMLDYQPSVNLGRVAAVVKKPRTCYEAPGAPGCPVFSTDGKVIGVSMLMKASEEGGMMALRSMSTVVLPAKEIAEAAEQARKKASEPKKAEAAEPKEGKGTDKEKVESKEQKPKDKPKSSTDSL